MFATLDLAFPPVHKQNGTNCFNRDIQDGQDTAILMPEGLLDTLGEQEVRDLIYYLGRPGQVPLPK